METTTESSYVLTWNPNPGPELVTGYNIYQRQGQSNAYKLVTAVTGTSFDPGNYLTTKKNGFRVTAFNANGEGPPSDTAAINKR